jgi:hypothetical protein
MYFITSRDPELVRDDSVLRNIYLPLVADRSHQRPEILTVLFNMYFEMLKRGEKVFKINLIKDLATSLRRAILNYPTDIAVKIINYKEDIIQSE